jgi:hypothetical protein
MDTFHPFREACPAAVADQIARCFIPRQAVGHMADDPLGGGHRDELALKQGKSSNLLTSVLKGPLNEL